MTIVSIALEVRHTGKFTTIVLGLPPDDARLVLKTFKRTHECAGNLSVLKDDSVEIRIQGDQQRWVRILLIELGICTHEMEFIPIEKRKKYQPAFVHDDE